VLETPPVKIDRPLLGGERAARFGQVAFAILPPGRLGPCQNGLVVASAAAASPDTSAFPLCPH
jgi:hypothetical protein